MIVPSRWRVGALALLLLGCATPTRSLPLATSTAALEAPAPTPEVWPAPKGTPAPVDGLHLTPTRYTALLQAEATAGVCLLPSSNSVKPGGACAEPAIKASTAFWVGAAVGGVVTVAVSGVLIYGAVEMVKAAK